MPQKRDPFIWMVDGYVRDGVDLVLKTVPLTELNKVIVIEGVAVCNHNGDGGDIEVGVVQAERLIPRRTHVNCLVGMWYRRMRQHTILSNMQVYARFIYENIEQNEACVDGHHCEMTVGGYVLEEFTTP